MCSSWCRSQFNKIEKGWVRIEILCLNFLKIPSNKYIKSRKVATCYFSYVRNDKATLSGGNRWKYVQFINVKMEKSFWGARGRMEDLCNGKKIKSWFFFCQILYTIFTEQTINNSDNNALKIFPILGLMLLISYQRQKTIP